MQLGFQRNYLGWLSKKLPWLAFKEITLVGSNQDNYFQNATACSKHTDENDCRNSA